MTTKSGIGTQVAGAVSPVAAGILSALGNAPWWVVLAVCLVLTIVPYAASVLKRWMLHQERMSVIHKGRQADSAAMLEVLSDQEDL